MYKTVALTKEQYIEIIRLIRGGGYLGTKSNEQVAFALVLEGNLLMRIGDILNLKLKDIVNDGRALSFTSYRRKNKQTT